MNENTGKTKKELRKEILKRREALEAEMVAESSAEICHMIQALNMYEEAEDLCLYMPIRNEVDLEILVSECGCRKLMASRWSFIFSGRKAGLKKVLMVF